MERIKENLFEWNELFSFSEKQLNYSYLLTAAAFFCLRFFAVEKK